jgi:GNAT superfamily N-acetyltransferase
MEIISLTFLEVPDIKKLAYKIWNEVYPSILSREQINYMLDEIYNEKSLALQMEAGHHFFGVKDEHGNLEGFFSVSSAEDVYKLQKLYLSPLLHGKGLGKVCINYVKEFVFKNKGKSLILNVNRNNPAVNFYKKNGFEIIESVDIPFGEFTLNDYIMEHKI